MKIFWKDLDQRFSRLTKRERGILLFGGVGAILILGFWVVDASLAKGKLIDKQITQVTTDAATARAQTQVLIGQLAQNPDDFARSRVAALTGEINALDEQLRGVNRGLVPPQRMAGILEEMLARNPGIELVRLRTLPVSYLIERTQSSSSDERANVYKHGLEMTLQGRYLDLLKYLEKLEALPWQMFWARVSMDAEDSPSVRITVTVFTLSLDKNWLVV